MTQNEVHALFWPWAILSSDKEKVSLGSENAVLPFKGSALLSSPRESRIIPIGGVADLSKLSESGQRDLYELPLVVGNESKKLLQIQGDETRWEISLSGARTRYETDEANQTQETSESIAIFDWWDAFDDISNLGLEPDGAIGWNNITEWFSKEKSSKDPRRALIVEIAETVGPKLNDSVMIWCQFMRSGSLMSEVYDGMSANQAKHSPRRPVISKKFLRSYGKKHSIQ
jgi:hypothetical protein